MSWDKGGDGVLVKRGPLLARGETHVLQVVALVHLAVLTEDAVAFHFDAALPGDLQLGSQPLARLDRDVDALSLNQPAEVEVVVALAPSP